MQEIWFISSVWWKTHVGNRTIECISLSYWNLCNLNKTKTKISQRQKCMGAIAVPEVCNIDLFTVLRLFCAGKLIICQQKSMHGSDILVDQYVLT